jgi:hypothetical protein
MTKATARPDLEAARVMSECEVHFTRRSGPGGQNRNKVETAVVLVHGPSGFRSEASERRSQAQNRAAALDRLRLTLALELRQSCAGRELPSRLWRSRLRGGLVRINPEHEDFPTLLAEALDVVDDSAYDLSLAASRLETTGSQLVKLLKLEPRAMLRVNSRRRERGLGALR